MFDWWEYWKLAQDLAATGEEARTRTAVSRAYYAAYHRVRSWAESHGFQTSLDPGVGVHGQLWRWMASHADPDANEVAEMGWKLRDQRTMCDYDDEVIDLGEDFAQGALDKAEDMCDAIRKLSR